MSAPVRHFLDIDRFSSACLRRLLDCAHALKRERKLGGTAGLPPTALPLAGRSLALIFEKPSTRTRVSFEVAMRQLGGDVVVLNAGEMQLGRGETIADTARVLSRYVDAIMLRTDRAAKLHELAAFASIPVINGLTDASHPCQVMADVMTFEEHRGPLKGRVVAWSGDGNNVARSWIHAAARFGCTLRLACPESLMPPAEEIERARAEGAAIELGSDLAAAVRGADCVITDTWVSMNNRDADQRRAVLASYQIDSALMAQAAPGALFMHCLPAHRGEEVTEAVIDGVQSVVWDEAENRMHIQKAILLWCLGVESCETCPRPMRHSCAMISCCRSDPVRLKYGHVGAAQRILAGRR
ncbi:Ornithine carbamoyltransferase [uncultured Gammaproteobacteria bacterium]